MISRTTSLLIALVLLAGLSSAHLSLALPMAATNKDGSAAVATVHGLATKAGLDAVAQGGNAIDAALAAAFTLGVVDGQNSGIGGGCFILARLADGTVLAIDGREMAPALATPDMFLKDGKAVPEWSKTGALAIGVPGSVQALYELQKRAGKLSFADTLLPAADLAEKGVAVSPVLAARLQRVSSKLAQFPASAAIFLPDGQALKEGEILQQADLADTYRKLAKHGPAYFYTGDFARAVEAWMKKHQGRVRAKDFKAYHTVLRAPVASEFEGYELVGFPPPSSGGVHVAQILTMLDILDASRYEDAERYHLIIEASKRAFADRAYWMGDADFVSVPKGLLDKSYLKQRSADITLNRSTEVEGHGLPPNYETYLFGKHTTHLATADKHGNWVAITTTVNTSFGSGVVIPGSGVLMNNQMDDFTAQPGVPNAFGLVGSEANAVAPGKRPLSSMSPTLVFKDGQPVLSVGAAGGPTIISQVAQTLFNYLALQLPLDEAMARVRLHHQWQPDRVFIDSYADEELRAALQEKGHTVVTWPAFGATQAISIENGKLNPQSEPRIQPD